MTTPKDFDHLKNLKIDDEVSLELKSKFKAVFGFDGVGNPTIEYPYEFFKMPETKIVDSEFSALRDLLLKVDRGAHNCVAKDREKYLRECVEFSSKALRLLLNNTWEILSLEQKKEFNTTARTFIMEAKDKFFVGNEECFDEVVVLYYQYPI